MKYIQTFDAINEAKLSAIHNAAKKGSYPISLVVIENGKVVKQELVGTPQIVPAAFNQLKKEYPNAIVHVEDRTGKRLFSESVSAAYNNLEKIFGTDQESMDMFQGIEDKGTVKDMIAFIDEFGNEEMLSRYGIKSTSQVKKLAEFIMGESVTEGEDTIGGLNKMANTDLERIADYADMIKDRMSQGQTLDAWMYSKISDSVKNLNSVHDTMDGNDGVNEAKDSFYIKQLTDTFDKFKLPRKYEIMMDSLFGGGSKIAVLRKRNTYGGGAMIDTHRKDGGSNYEGFIEILSSRSGRPIPGKSKFDNIDDAMQAATKFVDSIKESVTDASNNLEKIFGTDQETMDIFQGIEDKGTVKDMAEFIDEFGNEEELSRYGIKSTAQVKKLAKTIMNESYKGNFTDFKYDLELALDNMGISFKAIKSVKKKGKGYEVRLSSYMSDKSTWEKIGDTIGATLISFKPGSINIGIYE